MATGARKPAAKGKRTRKAAEPKNPLKLSAHRWNWAKVMDIVEERAMNSPIPQAMHDLLQDPFEGHEMPSYQALKFAMRADPELRQRNDILRGLRGSVAGEGALHIINRAASGGELDTVALQSMKLALDGLKWWAGKNNPDEYGDRQKVEHSGTLNLAEVAEALQGEGIEDVKPGA